MADLGIPKQFRGSSGVGVPPNALYYLASPTPVEVQRANIVVSVTVLTIITLISIAPVGGVTIEAVLRALILTPTYVIGIWSGASLFDTAPIEYFKRAALWLPIATGISAIVFGGRLDWKFRAMKVTFTTGAVA